MTETTIIAIATSLTAIVSLVTLIRLEQQRRIAQHDPFFLLPWPSTKILLLSLMRLDAEGQTGNKMVADTPFATFSTDDKDWVKATDILIRYGLAEANGGYIRVTDAGKAYAWKKYGNEVRAILLRASNKK